MFHQLRLLLVLGEELHFGRAAARLFISQSALSQQIRDLEKRLGVRLFERGNKTMGLTAPGRVLLSDARTVVDALDQLRRTADAQRRQLVSRDPVRVT
ncbi:LysR family transcriptional regulator [Streptomyces sp. HC307]|uniref:LysR family transcriptional regulator n=1 Tax=Streptomyces flavusporus TaxID=3385496 RepID=UPI00391728F5